MTYGMNTPDKVFQPSPETSKVSIRHFNTSKAKKLKVSSNKTKDLLRNLPRRLPRRLGPALLSLDLSTASTSAPSHQSSYRPQSSSYPYQSQRPQMSISLRISQQAQAHGPVLGVQEEPETIQRSSYGATHSSGQAPKSKDRAQEREETKQINAWHLHRPGPFQPRPISSRHPKTSPYSRCQRIHDFR